MLEKETLRGSVEALGNFSDNSAVSLFPHWTGLAVSESHQKLAKPVPRRSGGKTQMKRILDLLQRRPGSEEFNLAEKLRARASRTLKVYEASFSVLMLDTDLYSAGFVQKRLVKGMSEEEKITGALLET